MRFLKEKVNLIYGSKYWSSYLGKAITVPISKVNSAFL